MKVVLAILLFFTTAYAQPRYWAIDHLGGAKYGDVLVRAHPKGFAAGFFTNVDGFGDALPVIDRLLATGKVPLVRYNLAWSDTHSFSVRDFPRIVAEARRVVVLINKYPGVECEVSGATEHKFNSRDARTLANLVLRELPERCVYVNNPWQNFGSFIAARPRIKNEVHGKDAQKPKLGGKYNWSADGSDVFDINITAIKRRLRDADVFFFWTSQINGRRIAGDTTPRAERKFWATDELIQALAFLSTDQGKVSLPEDFLVKPKSDQHYVPPAPRELKPVFIAPVPDSQLQLRANGKTYTSGGAEPFIDSRSRFYFNLFGYEMVQDAGANVFELGAVREREVVRNGKKVKERYFHVFGTTNPAFRQGSFR